MRGSISSGAVLAFLAGLAIALVPAGSAQAQVTVLSTGGSDSWNTGTWSDGVPSGTIDVEIAAGVAADVRSVAPDYTGMLTLNAGSSLAIGNVAVAMAAVQNGTGITMYDGTRISGNDSMKDLPPIILAGNAEFYNGGDWNYTNFNGPITGTGDLTVKGFNGADFRMKVDNTWTGNLIVNAADRWILTADAAGAFGTGDVTVNPRNTSDYRSAVLEINAADAMADTATLTLNGKGWSNSNKGTYQYTNTRLQMNADDTVGALWIDGAQIPDGSYTGTSDPADWIGGSGTLTVLSPSTVLDGDADGDGDVDSADYIMVKAHFGGAPAVGTEGSGGDFNDNGTVDWDDLQTLMEGMNSATGGAPIPEPATLLIMLAGGLPALLKRRRLVTT